MNPTLVTRKDGSTNLAADLLVSTQEAIQSEVLFGDTVDCGTMNESLCGVCARTGQGGVVVLIFLAGTGCRGQLVIRT